MIWFNAIRRLDLCEGQADVILANSLFTARVFKSYFPSIRRLPRVVYPGINLAAYEESIDSDVPQVADVLSYARVNDLFLLFTRDI